MFYICLLKFYIIKLFGENQNKQSFSFEPSNFNYTVRASMFFTDAENLAYFFRNLIFQHLAYAKLKKENLLKNFQVTRAVLLQACNYNARLVLFMRSCICQNKAVTSGKHVRACTPLNPTFI